MTIDIHATLYYQAALELLRDSALLRLDPASLDARDARRDLIKRLVAVRRVSYYSARQAIHLAEKELRDAQATP